MKKIYRGIFKKRLILSFAIVVFILLTPLSTQAAERAPDFTVETTTRDEFTLSEQDEPVLIEFMTPLCSDCERVEEKLRDLHPIYEENISFISIDISDTPIEELRRVKEDRHIPWIVGRGDPELFTKYGGSTVPRIIIINRERFITFEEDGIVSEGKLEREIEEVIAGEGEIESLPGYGIYGLAILSGVTSFFSPCSFPLLPSYIAYYVRDDKKEKKKKNMKEGIKMGVEASLGIVLVFGVVGIMVVSGGIWLKDFIPYLQFFIGIIIALLGLFLLTGIEIGAYLEEIKNKIRNVFPLKKKKVGHAHPFYYGMGYGAGSAGCTAPVFIAVLLASWLSRGFVGAITVLTTYLVTMTVLMVVFSVLIVFLREDVVKDLSKAVQHIDRISGFVLLAAGLYLIYLFS